MSKLPAKQPTFGHRTVREARIAGAIEARVCGHNERQPGYPKQPRMTERRVKKVMHKRQHDLPLGAAEQRVADFWCILQCMAIDDAMLRNAY